MTDPKENSVPNKISTIFSRIQPDLEEVNKIILNNSKGESKLISEIAQHIMLPGGKRIRPVLTILGAKICNYNTNLKQHYNLAAAVELIHTATLLHDDVVDESHLRRGKKSANAIWGNKASILVGDYLLSTAFQLMVKTGSIKVLDLLSNTSRIMSDGEVMQLMNSTDIQISQDKYLQIIEQKTAILFAAAATSGSIIADANSDKEKALYDFGINLGVSFQIMDDILDYSSSSNVLGKDVGDDFFEGKITLPIILAYKDSNNIEKKRIEEIFQYNISQDIKDNQLLEEMTSLIEKYNSANKSFAIAQLYHKKALDNLNIFDQSEEKDSLMALADYAISRIK